MPKVPGAARCKLDLGQDRELAYMRCLTAKTKNGFPETNIRSLVSTLMVLVSVSTSPHIAVSYLSMNFSNIHPVRRRYCRD